MASFQGEDTALNQIIFNLIYYQFFYFLFSIVNFCIVILPGLQRFVMTIILSLVIIIVHAAQGFPNVNKTNPNLPANICKHFPDSIKILETRNTVTVIMDTLILRIPYNLSYYRTQYFMFMIVISGFYVFLPFYLSGVIFPILCIFIHATTPNFQITDRGNIYEQFLRRTTMDCILETIGLHYRLINNHSAPKFDRKMPLLF